MILYRSWEGWWYRITSEGKSISLDVLPNHYPIGMDVEVRIPDRVIDVRSQFDGMDEPVPFALEKIELDTLYEQRQRIFMTLCHIDGGYRHEAIRSYFRTGLPIRGGEYRYRDSHDVSGILDHEDGVYSLKLRHNNDMIPIGENEVIQLMPYRSRRSWEDLLSFIEGE